mmetsp:Transcript_28576/g.69593  ORF Transcript_28576/g.69593 Transcript_28576/m.69593 type:complete len:93 (-) Transcript_28576:583-861(-)
MQLPMDNGLELENDDENSHRIGATCGQPWRILHLPIACLILPSMIDDNGCRTAPPPFFRRKETSPRSPHFLLCNEACPRVQNSHCVRCRRER